LELIKKILEPSNKYKYLKENENKSGKIRKILGRVWASPKRILKSFCTHEPLDASAYTHNFLFDLEN
jgi:hypothetical protein